MLHAVNDLADSVHAILRASAELSREQAALDQDRERDPAPRDFAVGKMVEAFNRFAAGAQAAKKPLAIKITLPAVSRPMCSFRSALCLWKLADRLCRCSLGQGPRDCGVLAIVCQPDELLRKSRPAAEPIRSSRNFFLPLTPAHSSELSRSGNPRRVSFGLASGLRPPYRPAGWTLQLPCQAKYLARLRACRASRRQP